MAESRPAYTWECAWRATYFPTRSMLRWIALSSYSLCSSAGVIANAHTPPLGPPNSSIASGDSPPLNGFKDIVLYERNLIALTGFVSQAVIFIAVHDGLIPLTGRNSITKVRISSNGRKAKTDKQHNARSAPLLIHPMKAFMPVAHVDFPSIGVPHIISFFFEASLGSQCPRPSSTHQQAT